jgi:hypothetical protein
MSLRYSKTPQVHFGQHSAVDKVLAKIPQGAQSMATAPVASPVPHQIIDVDGKVYWARYSRDAWEKVVPVRDSKGQTTWPNSGVRICQPIAWLPRLRQR